MDKDRIKLRGDLEKITSAGGSEICEIGKMLKIVENCERGYCGKCLPCILAPIQITYILRKISEGTATLDSDLSTLRFTANNLKATARCKGGKELATALSNSLSNFHDTYKSHIELKRCAEKYCKNLIEYRIIEHLCKMCGKCKEVCDRDAIIGEPYVPYLSDNTPYYIQVSKCTRCGECLTVCPENAIEII